MNKCVKLMLMGLIGGALLTFGCGETEQQIAENNAKSRAAVEAGAGTNDKIKSSGSVIAKKMGGSANITLPDNQKLELVTWKGDNLWILYRPMRDSEEAEDHIYQEDSKFGLLESKLIIREVKKTEDKNNGNSDR